MLSTAKMTLIETIFSFADHVGLLWTMTLLTSPLDWLQSFLSTGSHPNLPEKLLRTCAATAIFINWALCILCDTREVLFIYWNYPFIKSVSYCISPFSALAVHSFNKAVSILESIFKRFCNFTVRYRTFPFLLRNVFQASLNPGELGATVNKCITKLKDNNLMKTFPKLSLKWICYCMLILSRFYLSDFSPSCCSLCFPQSWLVLESACGSFCKLLVRFVRGSSSGDWSV